MGSPAAPPQNHGGCGFGGDPVDCSTGIFIRRETDLRLSDIIPIEFTRTYLSQDPASRPFGIGTTDSYELYLTNKGAPNYTAVYLILPDGEEVQYTNTSSNQSYWAVANYVPTLTSNSMFYGSVITWNSSNNNGWLLRLKNGTVLSFPANGTTPAGSALLGITDRYGNQLTISRDANGNITQIASPNGRWLEFTHDSSNRITQATDNIGRTVSYTYDSYSATGRPTCNSSGLLCAVTDANGGITSYTYDSADRMLTVTDARGYTHVTNTYDPASGRVSMQTLADGTSTYQFAYTLGGNGQVSQTDITDPNGNIEQKIFDTNGFATSDTFALGISGIQQTFTYGRDPNTELITSVTDPLNRETGYGYDGYANVTSVTRLAGTPNAVTTTFSYDPTYSQLTSVLDPLNHTWTLGRDGQGNLTSITDPLNHTINLTYYGNGQPQTIADATGDTAHFNYTSGDLSSVVDPLGKSTGVFIDGVGRLGGITDPVGKLTTFGYDPLDRVTSITDANGNATTLQYDGNSNLLKLTDANHNQTSYGYDSRNRLISRTDGLQVSETYGYDASGNLTAHTDRNGNLTAYHYDALNRRSFAGFGFNGTSYQSTINYGWDAGNRLTQAVDSTAGTITRGYDGLDRLTSETTPQGSISYGYDSAGRRTLMTVAGQAAVSYSYDNANRLTSLAQGSSNVVALAYDSAGRRTCLTLPNGVIASYAYDSDSHVTSITYGTGGSCAIPPSNLGNLTYSFDAAGRVTADGGSLASVTLPANVSGNTFNADNEMTAFNGATLTYDANGNLSADSTHTYAWDSRNHLSGIGGGVAASFLYDALGRRASKTTGGTTTQFLYDRLNPVQEISAGNPPSSVNANLLTGLALDEYFSRTDSSGGMSFLRDVLGSTVALTDSTGALNTQYTYEPFGATTASGPANANPYQFTGRENDGTGLYFNRARYYSPTYQRFVSQDPIGFAGGDANMYQYAFGAPTVWVDPLGLYVTIIVKQRRHRSQCRWAYDHKRER